MCQRVFVGSCLGLLLQTACLACSSSAETNSSAALTEPIPAGMATLGAGAGGGVGTGAAPASSIAAGGLAEPTEVSGAGGLPSGTGGNGPAAGGAAGGSMPKPPTPEPLPEGVPGGYELVYEQSFATSESMEDLLLANPDEWRHVAEGYAETIAYTYEPPFRSPFSVALIKAIEVGSFVMEMELRQTSAIADEHRDMVLLWNFVSPSQFYYCHLGTVHDDVSHQIHIVNQADRTPISLTFTDGFDWGDGVWRTLQVRRDVAAGTMAVFDMAVSDSPILTAEDSNFTTGRVGFGSFDNTGQGRNLRVWAPAGEVQRTEVPFSFSN